MEDLHQHTRSVHSNTTTITSIANPPLPQPPSHPRHHHPNHHRPRHISHLHRRTLSLDTATLQTERQTRALDAAQSTWQTSAHQLSSDALHSTKTRQDGEIWDFLGAVQKYDQAVQDLRFRFRFGFGFDSSAAGISFSSSSSSSSSSLPDTTGVATTATTADASSGSGSGNGGTIRSHSPIQHPYILPHHLYLISLLLRSLHAAHAALASASWRIAKYASLGVASYHRYPTTTPTTTTCEPKTKKVYNTRLVYSSELGGRGRWVRRETLDAELACYRFRREYVEGRIRGCTEVLERETRVLEGVLAFSLSSYEGEAGGVGAGATRDTNGEVEEEGDDSRDDHGHDGNHNRKKGANIKRRQWWCNPTRSRTRVPRHETSLVEAAEDEDEDEDEEDADGNCCPEMSGALLFRRPRPQNKNKNKNKNKKKKTKNKPRPRKKTTACEETRAGAGYPLLPLLAYQGFKLIDRLGRYHGRHPAWTERMGRWMLDRVLVVEAEGECGSGSGSGSGSGIILLRRKVETRVLMCRRERDMEMEMNM